MCGHEYKTCARCSTPFECKVGSIHLCQCSAVTLTADQRDYVQEHFDDCLCARCLTEMKAEHINKEFSGKLKKILGTGH